jgi:alkylation response protein AidB-like acyl-CoA dehydrogenase
MTSNTTEHLDTEEQRAFRLKARAYMAGRLPPRVPGQPYMDWDDKALVALDRRTERLLWEGGLAGITVPKEYGGLGLDRRFEEVFIEECVPYRLAWHTGNNYNIVLPTMLAHGTEAQKKQYIPKMLNGEHIWCQMTSEPSGGSDLFGLLTKAEKRGDKWVLNGSKVWTTGGLDSDMGLCLARTDPTVSKYAGLTMFLVPMKTPGLTAYPLTLNNRTKDFCQEYLDNVEVPLENVLGEVNGGWTVASTQLASERAATARGWYIGAGGTVPRQNLELSRKYVEYARELGVADDPCARQLIGEMFVLDAVGDLTPRRVAAAIRAGVMPPTAGAVASLASSTTGKKRTAAMSALAGPAGIVGPSNGGEPSVGMTRVWLHRIGGGTAEMLRNNIADRVLGLPREPATDKDVPFNQLRQNAAPKKK